MKRCLILGVSFKRGSTVLRDNSIQLGCIEARHTLILQKESHLALSGHVDGGSLFTTLASQIPLIIK